MGMYDNYDREQANTIGIIFLVFMLVLCLLMVGANLFAGAGIAWKWVFVPIWGPAILGFILTAIGVRPPGQ